MKYLTITLALTAFLPMSAVAEMTTAEWRQPGLPLSDRLTDLLPGWPQPPENAITHCFVGSVYQNGWATICPERGGVDNSAEAPAEQEQEPECEPQ